MKLKGKERKWKGKERKRKRKGKETNRNETKQKEKKRIILTSVRYEEWCLLGCYGRVAIVRTDVSEEPGASIRVTRIGEL
jgi:hypothetical protein